MYMRYVQKIFTYYIIGNATPTSKGFRSLRLTNTRLAFFYIQIASVLPMHGFDPGDNNANHTEGGWTDEPVGQEHLWSPHCQQPGSCKLVRCIGNTCLYRQPAPEEFFSFHVTAEQEEIMLTLLGFNSFRLLRILEEGFPMHTLQRKGHGIYFP